MQLLGVSGAVRPL